MGPGSAWLDLAVRESIEREKQSWRNGETQKRRWQFRGWVDGVGCGYGTCRVVVGWLSTAINRLPGRDVAYAQTGPARPLPHSLFGVLCKPQLLESASSRIRLRPCETKTREPPPRRQEPRTRNHAQGTTHDQASDRATNQKKKNHQQSSQPDTKSASSRSVPHPKKFDMTPSCLANSHSREHRSIPVSVCLSCWAAQLTD